MEINPYSNKTSDELVQEMIAFISAGVPVPTALLERLDTLEGSYAEYNSIPAYV